MYTFQQFLEVHEKHLKTIQQHSTRLQNLFPQSRILIPLNDYPFLSQAQQHIPNLSLQDLLNGYYQKGNQKIRIGKLLPKSLQDQWSTEKDKLKNHDNYSIIISKEPLDLLRMSDHITPDGKQIQSCHSPNREFFNCAIKEAQTGGAIAYAVKTKDLQNVNLQAPEIFQDRDRNQQGITPYERLRLRRFTYNNQELLIPELRSYPASDYQGKHSIPGFKDAVNHWAKTTQHELIQEIMKNPQEYFQKFQLRGGSYQDNSASQLWEKFLQTPIQGTKKSQDQQGTETKTLTPEQIQHQAQQALNNHARYWKHPEDLHPKLQMQNLTLHWNATVSFYCPIDHTPNTNPLQGIDLFFHHHHPGTFHEFSFSQHHDHLLIYANILPDQGDLQDFEHFLDQLDAIDYNYDSYLELLHALLAQHGFLDSTHQQQAKNLKHFNLILNYEHTFSSTLLQSENIMLGTLADFPPSRKLIWQNQSQKYHSHEPLEFAWTILSGFDHMTKINPFANQPTLRNFATFYATNKNLNVNALTLNYQSLPATAVYLNFQAIPKEQSFHVCQKIDQHWEQLETELPLWWKDIKQHLSLWFQSFYPSQYKTWQFVQK
jgi:hypothetical protein